MKKRSFKKRTIGSYPFLTVVLSIALSLSVVGLLGALLLHAESLTSHVKKNIELHIYLNPELGEADIDRIKTILSSKPYTAESNGKPRVSYVSQMQATKIFIEETGENFVNDLEFNPIKASFIINIDPAFSNGSKLKKIKEEIEKVNGVFEVDLSNQKEEVIHAIQQNLDKISWVLIFFASIAIFTIILLIKNTIKLAVYSQRFLIRSMQLVGATSWFIQRPFILRSAIHGLIAGGISAFVVFTVIQYSYTYLTELKSIADQTNLFIVIALLPVLGATIAVLSTYMSVSRYLKLSLDELY